jgi:hypothetical protein
MGDSRLSPEEIRAAAEVHSELGPDYHDAVVQSFLDKLDGDVRARIDAQLGARPARKAADPALLEHRRTQLGAMVAGSVLTAVASGAAVEWSVHYQGSSSVKALALVWAVLAVLYLVYAWRLRRR